MAFSTFEGPVRSGTVRYTTGVTEGQIANVGLMVLAQSNEIDSSAISTAAVLPAGSQIISVFIDTTTLFNAATTVEFGTIADPNKYVTTSTITSVGRVDASSGITADAMNVGTTDVVVLASLTGTATAGAATVTVVYLQKASDGASAPTATQN